MIKPEISETEKQNYYFQFKELYTTLNEQLDFKKIFEDTKKISNDCNCLCSHKQLLDVILQTKKRS